MPKTSVQYLTVDADFSGQRIDNFLVTYLKSIPKTRIYRIIRKGEVRVNKKRIAPSYRLQAGDQLRLPPLDLETPAPPKKPSQRLTEMLANRILYEDKNLLIINKPAGIPVHGGSGVSLGLIEAMQHLYPKLPQLELAHRLDADTSGCLILAKKRSILRELHELLRTGKILKIYRALTKGHWKKTALRVDAPLLKNHLSSGERIVRVNPEGKASVTLFNPLEIFPHATFMEVILETGRTHQIRVHAQYRGHPLAGDEKYGDREFNKKMREDGLKRLFLHAYSLELVLPSTGERIQVTAPLENDLQNVLTTLKNKA
jgi:23S rRNA pseudouridine955/2504/2580 synthase